MGSHAPRQRPDWAIFDVPKIIWAVFILLGCIATIPPAVIYYARTAPKVEPRIHLIQNMDNQPRLNAQQTSNLFRDNRAMRQPVAGTVARGAMVDDTHLWLGTVDGAAGGRGGLFGSLIRTTIAALSPGENLYTPFSPATAACAASHAL